MAGSVTSSITNRFIPITLRDRERRASLTISVDPRGASLSDIMRFIESDLAKRGYEITSLSSRRHKRR